MGETTSSNMVLIHTCCANTVSFQGARYEHGEVIKAHFKGDWNEYHNGQYDQISQEQIYQQSYDVYQYNNHLPYNPQPVYAHPTTMAPQYWMPQQRTSPVQILQRNVEA